MKNIPGILATIAILGVFTLDANAEYYMVYPASSACYNNCGEEVIVQHTYHRTYKKHTVKKHKPVVHRTAKHRRNYYHIDVQYVWYAYPGEVLVSPNKDCSCGCCGCSTNNYYRLKSRYSTSPVRYEHDDDATYYAPDLDRSTADDVNY